MRVLIDILHPAHVHFFRNFHAEMESRGHEVCITARDKDRSVELLRAFGLPYQQISTQKSGAGLAVEMAQRTPRLMKIMRTFRPDVMTGIMGPSIARGGRAAAARVPAVVFYDTEFAVQTNRVVYPLAYSVCTPDCYQGKVRGRHRHVRRATTSSPTCTRTGSRPDPARLAEFGVSPASRTRSCGSCPGRPCTTGASAACRPSRSAHLVEVLQRRGRVLDLLRGAADRRPRRPAPSGGRWSRSTT